MRPGYSAKSDGQWFAKRKSIMTILKEVMTNEASVLMDSDAANKAIDADAALQELGSDLVGEAYVTATITVWDGDARLADERLRQALTPDYPFRCKRVLLGDDYYRALEQDHVDLVTDPIDRITATSVMPSSSSTALAALTCGAPPSTTYRLGG